MATEAEIATFLAGPGAWGAPVEAIETHLSTIYLVGAEAWKRKKPITFVGHDYRTLEARRVSCAREVRMNRRLAPDVYLGEVPVTQEADGTLRVGGAGAPVDWLVRMRRVPVERTLERALIEGWGTEDHVARVGAWLTRFYRALPTHPIDPAEQVAALDRTNRVHGEVLARADLDGSRPIGAVAAFLDRRADLVGERGRHLVAGHGDLRPEHVVLVEPPICIDGLDVGDLAVDPVDELAWLALECERLGAPWAGPILLAPLRACAPFPSELVDFYQTYRCALRAHLYAVRLLGDPGATDAGRWRARAESYLALGASHADRLTSEEGA